MNIWFFIPYIPTRWINYRKSVYPSGAKSDPADAALILDFLCKHPERLRAFQPDTPETRTLQLLVEARREAVDDKTRYLNRLTAQLKIDRKSTRLNSSHLGISYAVFC